MEISAKKRKILFLDRDGVINKKMPEGDYVKRWDEFEFLPGAIDALKTLYEDGFEIVVVTNQRGVALGVLREEILQNIHFRMQNELLNKGVKISGIYYCLHDYKDGCECRKPKIGMLVNAARDHGFDFSDAVYIGDAENDKQAAFEAGCRFIKVDPAIGLAGADRRKLK